MHVRRKGSQEGRKERVGFEKTEPGRKATGEGFGGRLGAKCKSWRFNKGARKEERKERREAPWRRRGLEQARGKNEAQVKAGVTRIYGGKGEGAAGKVGKIGGIAGFGDSPLCALREAV